MTQKHNPNPFMNITETKTGKRIIEQLVGALKVGETVTARRMNKSSARWEEYSVKVIGAGQAFRKKYEYYVIDEDHSHDGQRKVETVTEAVCYYYIA